MVAAMVIGVFSDAPENTGNSRAARFQGTAPPIATTLSAPPYGEP